MIIVFGSLNMDLIFQTERAPEAGETILLEGYLTLPGGKGANQAVAAAKMGSAVTLAGCVGKDGFGRDLLTVLSDRKVDTSLILLSDINTGTAIITVEADGENRIMVAAGANMTAKAAQIPEMFFQKTNSILMQMETDIVEIGALARKASGKVGNVILNFAPARPIPDTLLKDIDILILNELEIVQLGEQLNLSQQGYLDIAETIARDFQLTCVVTLGGAGAIAYTKDSVFYEAKALALDQIKDTTGAGDAFCGTLAAMLDQGEEFGKALFIACAAGSLACLKTGAMNSYADREEVMKAA